MTPSIAHAAASQSKKALGLAAKAAAGTHAHAPVAVVGAKPLPLVNLFNGWTSEWLAVNASHAELPPAQTNHFLRCHFTNQSTDMDPRLLPTVISAAQHFHVDHVDIVSGFRHPKYNLMLRKKGHQVARDSEHTHGQAIDFRLPGITTEQLHTWAVAQKIGGVGFYKESAFVHMDVGKVRYWNGD